LDTVKLLNIS